MRVQLHWGARNTQGAFRITASSLQDALRVLMGRGEWGRFKGHIDTNWRGDPQGNVRSMRLDPTFTITMPVWPGYRTQAQTCKDEWDRMWRALRDHEDGHRQIFEDGVAKLVQDLEALEAPTGRQFNDLAERSETAMEAAQAAFDRATDHGASRGVELTINAECRPRPRRP